MVFYSSIVDAAIKNENNNYKKGDDSMKAGTLDTSPIGKSQFNQAGGPE